MADKVLIYGAGGHSGRLLARAAAARWAGGGRFELLLGGRREDRLAPLAKELGLPVRVIALDDAPALLKALAEPGLRIIVNAAGPFADTAPVLARAAVHVGCHYVDLNGEADVYRRLDDLGYVAAQAGVALVCGAGHSSATSDLLLEQALRRVVASGRREVGTVRIAFGAVPWLSTGSVRSAWRSVREQVVVMRGGPGATELRLQHEPVGRLERSFDFGDGPRIASAANLLDLYSARLTAQRFIDAGRLVRLRAIEGYIETGPLMRLAVQAGALTAPLLALPGVRQVVRANAELLATPPDADEAPPRRHTVLLQIDDGFGALLVDWRVDTPEPYVYSAQTVIGVVEGLQARPTAGWRTPAELFDVAQAFEHPDQGPWQGCTLRLGGTLAGEGAAP
ncbi:MAG: saccharopine dehydrogenase NADP-binding domain-containing protein [Rubrivivax sp.]